jgi:membrane-bound lytic murein transglycosylase D
LMLQKLASRWFPVIEPILEKNGIPNDFKYIALIESGLTNIVSPAGATGYWQLVESTGKVYGLEINNEVDERYHIEKSTEAACKYFKEGFRKFNNWTLVAASYNMGIAGIQRQLDKQKVDNYYDLLLNEETARYIYRIIAIKEIFSHPKDYGYVLREKDLYANIPTQKIAIDSGISDLADFAFKQGINYKILKYFNPWLRKSYLSNKNHQTYYLDIPKKGLNIPGLDELLVAVDTVKADVSVKETKDSSSKDIVHIVKKGETLASIAKQYNVEEDMVKVWNMLNDNEELKSNQEIVIFLTKQK